MTFGFKQSANEPFLLMVSVKSSMETLSQPHCSVTSHAFVQTTVSGIDLLRKNPCSTRAVSELPPRFLRHSDEHTVVGISAVLHAMNRFEDQTRSFESWGALAAPRHPGRLMAAQTLCSVRTKGVSGVSTQVIPQCLLHGMSSAVSVGLGMHGPNFGIGGGPDALQEGLTIAVGFLHTRIVPGIWMIFTQWDQEPVLSAEDGSPLSDSSICGLAMAIEPAGTQPARIRMSIDRSACSWNDQTKGPHARADHALRDLSQALDSIANGELARWSLSSGWGASLHVESLNSLSSREAA